MDAPISETQRRAVVSQLRETWPISDILFEIPDYSKSEHFLTRAANRRTTEVSKMNTYPADYEPSSTFEQQYAPKRERSYLGESNAFTVGKTRHAHQERFWTLTAAILAVLLVSLLVAKVESGYQNTKDQAIPAGGK